MAEINVNGDIIPNDDKWIYDWLEWDATCPNDVRDAIANNPAGERITVLVNSGGGSVLAGQEIYSMLAGRDDVDIKIQSLAGSAAAVIAMANKNEISPVAMIMIHNVSFNGARGDYREMKKNAEILQQMDKALANAFVTKTGMSEEEILKLMDRETWITANQALEMGFVDSITGSEDGQMNLTNDAFGLRLTDEIRQRVMREKADADALEAKKKELLSDLDRFGA